MNNKAVSQRRPVGITPCMQLEKRRKGLKPPCYMCGLLRLIRLQRALASLARNDNFNYINVLYYALKNKFANINNNVAVALRPFGKPIVRSCRRTQ